MIPAPVRISGHFGELLQGRLGPDGPVVLITLPCPSLAVTVWHLPGTGLTIHGCGQPLISPSRTRSFLSRLSAGLNGRVIIRAGMPAGGGAGVSTAVRVALASLAAPGVDAARLARACIACEGASDPLMFQAPERLLWASREGRIVRDLPPLPKFEILGGFWGRHRRTDPADVDFVDISDLVDPWIRAASGKDLAAIARISSESADRTLALRGPKDDPTAEVAKALGALGYNVAHTGSARGFVFAAGTVPDNAASCLAEAGFRHRTRFGVGG